MLKGKWALVTGATAGLGLAVAESLAGAGANIVLHDLNEPAQTRDRLRTQFGVDVVSVAADLSKRAALPVLHGSPLLSQGMRPAEVTVPSSWATAVFASRATAAVGWLLLMTIPQVARIASPLQLLGVTPAWSLPSVAAAAGIPLLCALVALLRIVRGASPLEASQ